MKKILVLGAGRSSICLIEYLLKIAAGNNYEITVADARNEELKMKNEELNKLFILHSSLTLDIRDESTTRTEIEKADLVISMLPAFLHPTIARHCVSLKKHLVTASYVSPEMRALDEEAKKAGIILMNEAGLDPGLDHASAMKIIDRIKSNGGNLISFKSYTGGLIAPESDDNPWGYKFTWNPRNVVLAGQGTAQYVENGKYVFIPYHKLFTRTEKIHIDGLGDFEGYANRDSLNYRSVYGIDDIPTLLRGTLRRPGYCEAWNVFVQLGMTDESYIIPDSENLSIAEIIESFLPKGEEDIRTRLSKYVEIPLNGEIMKKLEWLGIFSDTVLNVKNARPNDSSRQGSPALLLQTLLENKWKLKDGDIDMIVMQHRFEYVKPDRFSKPVRFGISTSLVVKGDDSVHTAMAKTVGFPVGIISTLILEGKINMKGVCIPTIKEIYEPLLEELETLDIRFKESVD